MKHQKKKKYKNSDPAKIIAKMDNRSFCPYHERFVIDEEIFVAFLSFVAIYFSINFWYSKEILNADFTIEALAPPHPHHRLNSCQP